MEVQFLEAADEIREQFIKCFVLSWEEFQHQYQALICERVKTRYPIDFKWYQDSYLWDKADCNFQNLSFADALTFLQQQSGKVLFMGEKGKCTTCRDKQIGDSVGEADARELVAEIKKEFTFLFPKYTIEGLESYTNYYIYVRAYVEDPSEENQGTKTSTITRKTTR